MLFMTTRRFSDFGGRMTELDGANDRGAATDPGSMGSVDAPDNAGSAVALASVDEQTDDSGALVLRLGGEIDMASVGNLRVTIDAIRQRRAPTTVIFDLEELRFMDSSGLALLLRIASQVPVEVRNPSAVVRRVIELSGLTATLPMTP